MKNAKKRFFINAVIIIFALVWLLPLIWMLFVSIKPDSTIALRIKDWFVPPYTLDNFKFIFSYKQANMGLWIFNSVFVALISTGLAVAFSFLASYSFAKIKFPLKKMWFAIILSSLMIPFQTLMLPLYILFKELGMLNTYFSLIAPMVASPIAIVILRNFISKIPESLFEAARLDGCGWFGTMWRVALPLTKNAIAAVFILLFLNCWNSFIWPFISITDPKLMTLPVGLPLFKAQHAANMAYPMAASAVSALPILIVYFILQKYIIKGITQTGIK